MHVPYEKVQRKILTGTESVKESAKAGQSVTVKGKANGSQFREFIGSGNRYTVHNTENCWYNAVTGTFHFEEYFDTSKENTANIVR